MKRRPLIRNVIGVALFTGVSGCISTGDNSEEETENESDTPTITTNNAGLKTKAVVNYQSGYNSLDSSKETLNTYLDSYDQENYSLVVTGLENFEETMDDVASSFADAADGAEKVGDTKVMEAALAGEREAKAIGDAGTSLKKSAEEAQKENWDDADEYLAEAETSLETAKEEHKDVMKASKVEERLMPQHQTTV